MRLLTSSVVVLTALLAGVPAPELSASSAFAKATADRSVARVSSVAQRQGRALDDLIDRATRYVLAYEQSFTLLVADEVYQQEIRRPPNPGTNLTRTNPGGGMLAGGPMKVQELRSDFLLVQLGEGAGWMQVREVFQLNGSKVRDRDDYLISLFV